MNETHSVSVLPMPTGIKHTATDKQIIQLVLGALFNLQEGVAGSWEAAKCAEGGPFY